MKLPEPLIVAAEKHGGVETEAGGLKFGTAKAALATLGEFGITIRLAERLLLREATLRVSREGRPILDIDRLPNESQPNGWRAKTKTLWTRLFKGCLARSVDGDLEEIIRAVKTPDSKFGAWYLRPKSEEEWTKHPAYNLQLYLRSLGYDRTAAEVAIAADCVVFGLDAESLKVLLIERQREPFAGRWALPGGFVDEGESPLEAARRELREETSLADVYLEQLFTFGRPGRDPRGWVVSVAHLALVNIRDRRLAAASDARDAGWFPLRDHPPLAFDHEEILDLAQERLRGKVRYQPIGFELLPRQFTLSELQYLYETILAEKLDKRNFRRRVLKTGLLDLTRKTQKGSAHHPARLYRFNVKKYRRLSKHGFLFEI